MEAQSGRKSILIIDRQDYWRELSAETLRRAGFSVRALSDYDYPPPQGRPETEKPNLVILGCASIKDREWELIRRILSEPQHLLVLCVSLPQTVMRDIFLAGVDDVADKTYDPAHLVELVTNTFNIIMPRDSYHAVERKEV